VPLNRWLKALSRPENLHYWVTGALALAAVPILMKLGLPLRFDWNQIASFYWRDTGAQSIFAASILAVVGFSHPKQAWELREKIKCEPLRLVFILAFAIALLLLTSWAKALILTVDSVVILELYERYKLKGLWRAAYKVGVPAAYFFVGLVLVGVYNMIVVSVRYFAAYDTAFYRFDLSLLRGWSVAGIAHFVGGMAPGWFFHLLEFFYLSLFAQIGACLILVSLAVGRTRGLQFVGTIMTAYYVTLAIFFIWPSHGPYYLCPDHFTHFPSTLLTYSLQKSGIAMAEALRRHTPPDRLSFQYLIAFPCMHITQPLIVLWYLRKWKRMVWALAVYDVALMVSIIGLEWHYVADLIGGIGVAFVAIVITNGREFWLAGQRRSGVVSYQGEVKSGSWV
jgi:hypothetical protein